MLTRNDFSLEKTIKGNEELPNFFEAFTFSQAKISIAEEANLRLNYSLSTTEPQIIERLRKVHVP